MIGDHLLRKRPDLDRRLARERYALSPDWMVETLGAPPPMRWVARSARGETISLDAERAFLWRTLAASGEVSSDAEAWPAVGALWKARALRLRGCLPAVRSPR